MLGAAGSIQGLAAAQRIGRDEARWQVTARMQDVDDDAGVHRLGEDDEMQVDAGDAQGAGALDHSGTVAGLGGTVSDGLASLDEVGGVAFRQAGAQGLQCRGRDPDQAPLALDRTNPV